MRASAFLRRFWFDVGDGFAMKIFFRLFPSLVRPLGAGVGLQKEKLRLRSRNWNASFTGVSEEIVADFGRCTSLNSAAFGISIAPGEQRGGHDPIHLFQLERVAAEHQYPFVLMQKLHRQIGSRLAARLARCVPDQRAGWRAPALRLLSATNGFCAVAAPSDV